ncbi:MAG TPA: allantoinase AllB [Gemmatimonadaceae bacterium]|jgi:allantoinase|nr:allantoinase AllB [Gemmatimonadaceae bacterium]
MSDFILRSRRVVLPGATAPATLHVANGRIERVGGWNEVPPDARVEDVGSALVMPGVVDTHVHANEPGRSESDAFESTTHAAAAGGITTLLDMPFDSIRAATSAAALDAKRAAARDHSRVNVEFIGGVVPGNTAELEPLRDAGVRAFKCFLSPTGVDEFSAVGEADLRAAFPTLARLELPLMVHAELPDRLEPEPEGGSRSYAQYLASRPPDAERAAVELLVRLMDEAITPPRVHIVHLSSPLSLDVIRDARTRGLPLTVETCPHYLTFAASEVPDGATEFKCAPPIRTEADRDGLWRALIDGDIDVVASDHSPCPPDLKGTNGDFFAAWGGIASLQFSLAATWTGARLRGVDPRPIATWMCEAPARLVGLSDRRARLAAGCDADIVVWNPDAMFRVTEAGVRHRHPITPYLGRHLFGIVERTYVGGRLVFERGT